MTHFANSDSSLYSFIYAFSLKFILFYRSDKFEWQIFVFGVILARLSISFRDKCSARGFTLCIVHSSFWRIYQRASAKLPISKLTAVIDDWSASFAATLCSCHDATTSVSESQWTSECSNRIGRSSEYTAAVNHFLLRCMLLLCSKENTQIHICLKWLNFEYKQFQFRSVLETLQLKCLSKIQITTS